MILQGIILFCLDDLNTYNNLKRMIDFLEDIRSHFNILLEGESLSLTLINPNLTPQVMHSIRDNLTLISHLESIELVVIECPSFDDQLLTIFAKGLPRSLTRLSLDLTGCESLRGQGFLQLFEKLDGLELTKLSLDFGSLYDINDIVVEGLTLLLSNLTNSLQEFYLDLYEVDQITGDGYLLLTEAITDLSLLTSLHLDFSANYNLTEDSLELLFAAGFDKLKHFTFKILDTDEIGGGSFFKLAESLSKMVDLEELCLTISTFDNLNHKGIYSIIRSISKLQRLRKLHLNLSNIDLPEKVITYLAVPPTLSDFSLDISCNRRVSFGDLVNIGNKIKGVKRIQLNLDFCSGIEQDVVEQIVGMICSAKKCFFLSLTDRNYSPQLQNSLIPLLMELPTLIDFAVSSKQPSKRMKAFQQYLKERKLMLWTAFNCKARDLPYVVTRAIIERLFYCS